MAPQTQTHPENTGFLGVKLLDIDADRAKTLKLAEERGVQISAVMEGSPADKAGIQPGDVVLAYNGETVLGAQQLSRLVRETPPGRNVKLQLWRNGKSQPITVALGAAAANSNSGSFVPFAPPNPPNSFDFPRPFLVWHNPMLGIEFERIDSQQLAEYFGVKGGVLVRSVQQGSPADKAGIRPGDVIFSVAQQAFSTEHDFSSLLRQHGPTVPLSVMRDHKRVDLMMMMP
jgi:serine protease Do